MTAPACLNAALFGGNKPADVSFRGLIPSTANSATHTFFGADIGVAAADRVIYVGAGGDAAAGASVTSVTCNGVAMAACAGTGITSKNAGVGIFKLLVPAGATADFVVTFSASRNRAGIAVWAVYGLQSETPVNTLAVKGTAISQSGPIDFKADGVVLAYGYVNNATATYTWTNITENAEQIIEAVSAHSAASIKPSSTATVTITATLTSSQESLLTAVSLR